MAKVFPLVWTGSGAPVAKWLLGTAGMVVGMIHVGGVTRLTHSGLSMTTWSPLGSLPPFTAEAWQEEFSRYKQYPEWEQRKSMTMQEFRFIYAWEYGHRMLGRVLGIVFVGPWLYFTVRNRIPPGFQPRMLGLLTMGASQGLVGWWMVKSGLGEDRRGDTHEIRVKPIRLATHLSMAFCTYGALLWTAWDILTTTHYRNNPVSGLRLGAMGVTSLAAVTVVSGALVAGNDAGRAFNTFPRMDGAWMPPEVQALYRTGAWRQEWDRDTALCQFHHRWMGMTTLAASAGLYYAGRFVPQAQFGLRALALTTCGQAALGIVTLLQHVPVPLGAAHQLGSVAVFTSGLYLVHSLRYGGRVVARQIIK